MSKQVSFWGSVIVGLVGVAMLVAKHYGAGNLTEVLGAIMSLGSGLGLTAHHASTTKAELHAEAAKEIAKVNPPRA